jgi:hypothetical protein
MEYDPHTQHIKDLRERQYNAEIAGGSTPAEAAIISGWKPDEPTAVEPKLTIRKP